MSERIDTEHVFDAAVIGAGVVGAAITRELVRYGLDVVLIEAASDVGAGTSKASTAIWHTGFDATPGTLEARLLARGYPLLATFLVDAGIAHERTGAMLVAWTQEEHDALAGIAERAAANGVDDLVLLDAATLYAREPHLGAGARAGLLVPREGILCPFSLPITYATDAVVNGAQLLLGTRVLRRERERGVNVLETDRETVRARWIVNAAGVRSDDVDAMFGFERLTIKPRRGELIVFDKLARRLLRHVILPVPTKATKGVLVAPTVFGNVLVGPTAEDRQDKTDTSTSEAGLASLRERGRKILPALMDEEITATYAGLRAAHARSEYEIHCDGAQQYVLVGGIRSTGISASLAIAEHVRELLGEHGVTFALRERFVQTRAPALGEPPVMERPCTRLELVAQSPDFGRVVCHCERVSRAELVAATKMPIPARTLDGLRRRTRCLQGRCQGFYCLAEVATLLAQETGVTIEEVLAVPPEGAAREGRHGA